MATTAAVLAVAIGTLLTRTSPRRVELSHGLAFTQARLAEVYAVAGDHAAAEALLGRLERKKACPYLIALVHASLHHKEKSLRALESGYHDQECGIEEIRTEDAFDFLHSDPRFQALLQELKSPG